MNKNIFCNSTLSVLNESQSNDLFIELDILLLKNSKNLNGYLFQENFIDEIVNNQEKYVGLPIVVDIEKLLASDVYNLKHNYSPFIDKFYTQEIGSYISFEKKYDAKGIAELHGKARISKRNPDLVQVLLDMYSSEIGLNFSVEVFAGDYLIDADNTLIIGASPNNYLISDCLVSFPAEPDSKALKLVAELNNSIQKGKGNLKKDIFAELSHSDIRSQLHSVINPNFDSDGYRIYDYWITDVFNDYCIVSDEKKAGVYYKYAYSIENDVVSLGDKSQVTLEYVAVNEKGGLNKVDAKELQIKLNEANETIVDLGKKKDALSEQVQELLKFKNEVQEKEAKVKIDTIINEVKESLTEDELKVLSELAAELDVDKVKVKVNEICANKYKETIKLTSAKDDFNYFAVSPQKDLSGDDLSKFNM